VNYTGKKMDPETGLYYFNQRYYDPSLGRFLTEDPAGQGLNPYAYAGMLVRDSGCESAFATSLSLINPDGLFFFEIGTFVGAAYGALIGGTQRMLSGGDFGEGAVDGFILGAKIGGTIGAAADGYTGGYATWTDSNPFFTLAAHTYAEAWNGRAGGGYGFGLDLNAGAGGGGNPAAPLYQPQYPQELSDGFDAYTQTGAVPESDFCYPCGGDFEGYYDAEAGGVYFLKGKPVGEKSLEDSVSPIDVFLVGSSFYKGVSGLFRVWGKQGERRFAMGFSNGQQFFRLDKHKTRGWHYHRWPDMSKHRPKEGGF
jgi:hypothetical protein